MGSPGRLRRTGQACPSTGSSAAAARDAVGTQPCSPGATFGDAKRSRTPSAAGYLGRQVGLRRRPPGTGARRAGRTGNCPQAIGSRPRLLPADANELPPSSAVDPQRDGLRQQRLRAMPRAAALPAAAAGAVHRQFARRACPVVGEQTNSTVPLMPAAIAFRSANWKLAISGKEIQPPTSRISPALRQPPATKERRHPLPFARRTCWPRGAAAPSIPASANGDHS